MKNIIVVFALIAISLLVGCANTVSQVDELKALQQLMQGSFSSQKQSEQDEDYYDIRLEMVPIWAANDNGLWLYVEQAAASALQRPYRQRVYHLTQLANGDFSSVVHELPNPLEYAGAWMNAEPLKELSPSDLTLREGCAVIMKKKSIGNFSGSTEAKACKSSLRGATYATSIVEINANGITSWDQGFDQNDEQVWGAQKGPYIFLRQY